MVAKQDLVEESVQLKLSPFSLQLAEFALLFLVELNKPEMRGSQLKFAFFELLIVLLNGSPRIFDRGFNLFPRLFHVPALETQLRSALLIP
jgi:hypothetical protein